MNTLTPQHQLVENYKKGREIPIIVIDKHIGEYSTLDHIVMVNKKENIVRIKPIIPYYNNYKYETP